MSPSSLVRLKHIGFVQALAVDGDNVLYADNADGLLHRLDRQSGAPVSQERRHADGITAIVVTNSGVATAGYDGVVAVGERQLRGHDGGVHCLAAHGDQLASGGFDGRLCVWHAVSGATRATWLAHDAAVTTAVWLDERQLVTGSRDRSIRLWDTRSRTELWRIEAAHERWVTRLARNGDKSQLLSCGEDGRVCLWDLTDGSRVACEETGGVGWALTWADDIAYSAMPLIRWRVGDDANGERIRRDHTVLPGLERDTHQAEMPAERAVMLHGSSLLAGADHGAISLFDLRTQTVTWRRGRVRVGALSAASAGGHLLTGWQNGDLRIDGRHVPGAHAFMAYCCVGLGPERAASAGFDGRLRLWDCDAASPLQEWRYPSPYVFSLRASGGEQPKRLLAAGGDAWQLLSLEGERPREIAHASELGIGEHSHGDLSADGQQVLIGGEADKIHLYAENGTRLSALPLPAHFVPVSDLRFLPNGTVAAVASASGCVALIDLETGVVTELHRDHEDWIRSVFVSPNGRWVASVSQNFRLRVFDLHRQRLRKIPSQPIDAACFTDHGRLLACVATSTGSTIQEIDLRDPD